METQPGSSIEHFPAIWQPSKALPKVRAAFLSTSQMAQPNITIQHTGQIHVVCFGHAVVKLSLPQHLTDVLPPDWKFLSAKMFHMFFGIGWGDLVGTTDVAI